MATFTTGEADNRNKDWVATSGGFGLKMLQKMGWTEGQGLGKNGSGIVEHVNIKKRVDNLGLGAKIDAHGNDTLTTRLLDYNSILKQLGSVYGTVDDIKAAVANSPAKGDSKSPEGDAAESEAEVKSKSKSKSSKSSKKSKDSKKDKKHKKRSKSDDDKPSKSSRRRLHNYHRVVNAKNVRNYSSHDLNAILAGSHVDSPVAASAPVSAAQSSDSDDEPEQRQASKRQRKAE